MLELIGAGFGRTGTLSMKGALEMLGLGPCHHMTEVISDPEQEAIWRAIARGGTPDWDRALAGYRSTVDWPAAAFWRELSRNWPRARILLTVRDPDSWHRSMEDTIFAAIREGRDPDSIGRRLLADRVFGGRIDDRDHVIGVYLDNIARVQAAFGPDRLLTYELGSGWRPLCAFLGVPVPDAPFPSSNSTAEFQARFTARQPD